MKSLVSITCLSVSISASLRENLKSLSKVNSPSLRAFQNHIADGFDALNGYGCWCYLDESWRDDNLAVMNKPSIQAHGKTVDVLDEACKNLINSYKCIEIDAEEAGIDDCDAQAVNYTPFDYFGSNGQTVKENCEENNVGFCAQSACIVEGTFTLNFLAFVIPGQSVGDHPAFNASYVHLNKGGSFDPDVECPGIANPVGSERECCGDFVNLNRHPFRLFSGFTTRSCCNGEVINNELDQCCNGVVFDVNEPCGA